MSSTQIHKEIYNNSKNILFELENDLNDEVKSMSIDELDKELELINRANMYKKNNYTSLPKNYGNKWTEEERKELLNMVMNSQNENVDNMIKRDNNDDIEFKGIDIIKIANKLGRTEGGIRSEIKKIIYNKYIEGDNPEKISKDLNLTFKCVKSIIKIFIEKESEQEISLLEKENKLLKLKIENYNLRKSLLHLNL